MSRADLGPYAVLFVMGAGWGLSVPLSKIAVSTGHLPLGLIFWQEVVIIALLGTICALRGKRLELGRQYWRLYAVIAMCGAVLPDIFFYLAAARLPAGIMAIVIASVPLFSLPIALALRNETFAWRRLLGLSFGIVGILLLVGPEASLPERAMVAFIPLALMAPLLYATEGNLVAKWGTQGLDSMQVILGAALLGMAVTGPLAVVSGQWINPLDGIGVAEWALVASAALHGLVYAVYVWLVGRAGSVFAAQTSYLVTGFGVLWSMLILSERYAIWVWLALAIMILGIALVQPRARAMPLAPVRPMGDAGPNA
ncbi:EamA-like transporter family protein [Roseovarius nanhaiticus]|uniref:EamA-like transporter family protein n=1 Tax=Roseovarius nanhaiticus TaxID=573024 RepID=A0A1N7G5G5_9RHOB|nr:DMT family transporter [Roseovarius nanhaiticus]SEK36602.1 EamA-like transporter family protein [Roseovarius nanhaiticus]SIS07847.1 EamA-like transporter family protein [Roseovarius nanhaiticus]